MFCEFDFLCESPWKHSAVAASASLHSGHYRTVSALRNVGTSLGDGISLQHDGWSLFLFVFVHAESGGSFAPPGGQQESDPGVSSDANGRWRPGRAHTAQTGRLQHPMGGADGQGKAPMLECWSGLEKVVSVSDSLSSRSLAAVPFLHSVADTQSDTPPLFLCNLLFYFMIRSSFVKNS